MKDIRLLLNTVENKRLLVVLPHPDDEVVVAAGLMQLLVKLDWEVKVVCVTNGTMGQINVDGKGRSALQIRAEELGKAMEILGVEDWQMLKHPDGYLNRHDYWHREIGEIFEDFNPGLVVSYGASGMSGHPDHIALGKMVLDYLSNWNGSKKPVLLWPAFTGFVREYLESKVKTAERLEFPDYVLELGAGAAESKLKAMKAHVSQNLEPPVLWLENDAREFFAVADFDSGYDFSYVKFDIGDRIQTASVDL